MPYGLLQHNIVIVTFISRSGKEVRECVERSSNIMLCTERQSCDLMLEEASGVVLEILTTNNRLVRYYLKELAAKQTDSAGRARK